jgi:hypothetical protein
MGACASCTAPTTVTVALAKVAPPLPVAWERHHQTPSHQSAPPSTSSWPRITALARLESQRTPTRLSRACASATNRDRSCWACFPCASHHPCDPFARTAGPHSSLLGDTPGSQRATRRVWSGNDEAVRCFPHFRGLAGPDWSVEWRRATEMLASDKTIRTKDQQGRGPIQNHCCSYSNCQRSWCMCSEWRWLISPA